MGELGGVLSLLPVNPSQHAQLHFSAVFHTKTLPLGRSCDRGESGFKTHVRGDKMRGFSRLCACFLGWFPMRFFAQKRFLEVCATTFSAHRVGICPHIAGRVTSPRGTRCAQKNHRPTPAPRGRSYATLYAPSCFFLGIFVGTEGLRLPFPKSKPYSQKLSHVGGGIFFKTRVPARTSVALRPAPGPPARGGAQLGGWGLLKTQVGEGGGLKTRVPARAGAQKGQEHLGGWDS